LLNWLLLWSVLAQLVTRLVSIFGACKLMWKKIGATPFGYLLFRMLQETVFFLQSVDIRLAMIWERTPTHWTTVRPLLELKGAREHDTDQMRKLGKWTETRTCSVLAIHAWKGREARLQWAKGALTQHLGHASVHTKDPLSCLKGCTTRFRSLERFIQRLSFKFSSELPTVYRYLPHPCLQFVLFYSYAAQITSDALLSSYSTIALYR
jgi:hypothetical protein